MVVAVLLSIVATYVGALIAIPIAMVIVMFTLGFGISIIPEQSKFAATYVLQFITYTVAAFAGLSIGYLILRSFEYETQIAWLIVPIAFDALTYAKTKFRFATSEAAAHNQAQKAMAVLGSVAAVVVGLSLWG